MRRTRAPKTGPDPASRRAARDLEESVEMLHRVFQSVDLFSRQTLRDFGVSGPQIWAMRTVDEAGVATMGDLSQRMHLHMSTVTGIVDRLEAAGLVTRERSDQDARVMEVRLTPKGRNILARCPEPPRSKVARRLQRLRASELRTLRSALGLIAEAMDIALDDPDGKD